MAKTILVYTPEGGSARRWPIDIENPAWDIAYVTEKETGWPWVDFGERLSQGSYIALRALVFALRKRDEPRLNVDAVQITLSEVDFEDVVDEPPAKKDKKKAGDDPEA